MQDVPKQREEKKKREITARKTLAEMDKL